MSDLKLFLKKVAEGESLSEIEAEKAFDIIMSGSATASQLGAFLMALRLRGETVEEITGAARIMRVKALQVKAPRGSIDTCGTGGDGSGTYNISTATALVVAGCGVPVAKHGNKAMSSKSGAADVLAEMGVNLDATPRVIERSLTEANIGFLFAQRHHTAMKHVAAVRQELGIRVIFNLLGPLSNPAGAKRQLLGVFAREWLEPLARTLGSLGSEKAWVVHGSDGLDELTTTGPTFVAALESGKVNHFTINPDDAGLPLSAPGDLIGGDSKTNAAALRNLLAGEPSAYRDIVLLNAAAALVIADKTSSLREGVSLAATAIDNGRAANALDKLAAISSGRVK